MSTQLISLVVTKDHAVPVATYGGSAVVKVDSTGGTVFYADNPQVSAAQNQGSIAPGASQTFTSNAWIVSVNAGTAVTVTITSIYDEWATITNPLNIGGGATPLVLTRPGPLAVESGTSRLPITAAQKIVSVTAAVNTAPTGAAVIVDVLKNGTTVFTTQANRPTIAAAANSSSAAVPDVTTLAVADYLQVNIAQVGSTIAGADLTVAILVQ